MPLFGRQHVRLPLIDWSRVVQRPESRNAPTTREIDCPHCGSTLRVAIRALNTRCTECAKHLRLEDIVIRGDSPLTRIVTCGSILVEPSARFSGMLQGSELVIAGRVMGTLIGTRRVEVTATGKVAGTVATRDLVVSPQSVVDGEIHILNADGSITTMATGADHAPPKYIPGGKVG
jgi:ribosomal protein S27E